MATFTNAQNSQNPNSKIEIKEDEVEKGILKQLFYKVEHKKIPQSRYRKLNVKKFLPIFFKTLFLIALTAVLIAIFKLENILCFAEKIAETSLIWHVLLTVLILIALICIAYLISYLWYTSEPVSYTHLDVYKRQVQHTGTSGQFVPKYSGFGELPNKHFCGPCALQKFRSVATPELRCV